jgi:two-component system chemotaxis response regulator CheY
MRVLIVEDDFTSRLLLQRVLLSYGTCDFAVDGKAVIDSYGPALKENDHCDLVCKDIMHPKIDGHETLRRIRGIENEMGINGSEEVGI